MKKPLLLLVFVLSIRVVLSQNIQLHYDLGKDRNYLTSTVEMFKPDKLGSTFLFVDMDYGAGDVKGVSLAYWEIARSFTLFKSPWAAHLEYNGGFLQWKAGSLGGAATIDDAWLAGVEYNYNNEDFSRGFTLQLLYKYIRNKHDASFQLTGVWYVNFLKNKMTFSGFADFWREDNMFFDDNRFKTTKFVFLSEPQLWYNLTGNFSLGSEVEVGSNFSGVMGLRVNPTVAAKWTFN